MILLRIISNHFPAQNSSSAVSHITQVKCPGHHTVASKATQPPHPQSALCPETWPVLCSEGACGRPHLRARVLSPLPGLSPLPSGPSSNTSLCSRMSLFTHNTQLFAFIFLPLHVFAPVYFSSHHLSGPDTS